jgi:hypothetical protein
VLWYRIKMQGDEYAPGRSGGTGPGLREIDTSVNQVTLAGIVGGANHREGS